MNGLTIIDAPFTTTAGAYTCLSGGANVEYEVVSVEGTPQEWEDFQTYIKNLRKPFQKICRLSFLNPDGSVAFAIDNQYRMPVQRKYTETYLPRNFSCSNKDFECSDGYFSVEGTSYISGSTYLDKNKQSAWLSDGSLSVNLQNGQRRSVDVTLSNADGAFDYSVNNLWFGSEIALDEGMILPDGREFYIPQGVFVINTPTESITPSGKTMLYTLTDKWSNIDGSLFGNLNATYEVDYGTEIFQPISVILAGDRGNGTKIDNRKPIYTDYYNGKTQTLTNGTIASLMKTPYKLSVDADGGNYASVILGLNEMIAGVIGYDSTGRMRIDPSQDDILDQTKPILWEFSEDETSLLGMSYSIQNTNVYNDYIVVGEELEDYSQPAGRAQNLDPKSDTNVKAIGRKTIRYTASGFSTDRQCKDLAKWKLKRSAVLQKAVTISCSQIMHIEENKLVTIKRLDKKGHPMERHLIQGFSRPLIGTGTMTVNCMSVNDFPIATVSGWNH